ncbi:MULTISPECIES: sigma 54-interacting transcriptional regulator [Sporosarcina]|uniref:sigma 54-interacting transcriptional regulator n=1 Tax=Sporosarcina TaxID=1569 RepID=UPI000A17DA39|nr:MULTISPECIES: sigma 54-interacting transcriptional regulator [Sporosarcina]ARK20813.1 transcriptional regulator [Sporosarcina ureae]PIC73102.1 transcriptional regulator [Sporosarcina sp. P17b]
MNSYKDVLDICNQFAVDHANIGIHAVDHSGRTLVYNRKMKEIEGLNLEDIKDHSILELFNFDKSESTLMKVLQSGEPQLRVKQRYWNTNELEITTMNDTYPIYEEQKLIGAIEFAQDITALEKFVLQPLRKNRGPITFNQITAHSLAMKSVISTAEKAADAGLPVLLIGETGVGKDNLAEAIHYGTSENQRVFHTFHCLHADTDIIRQLDETLQQQLTMTLFCERIDSLSISLQQSLLFVLQKSSTHQFIASIGDDPVELIASGTLLKELYYFFASFAIRIPPLRKRPEDIIPFAESYLKTRIESLGTGLAKIDEKVSELLCAYEWPGNLRELEFLLDEVSSMRTSEDTLTFDMLPLQFKLKVESISDESSQPKDFIVQSDSKLVPLDQYLREAERYYLQKAMKLHDDNITKTANSLGMSRQNLQYRLKKLKE